MLVGLAESEGAIANPKGLDLEKVMAHRRERRSMLDFPGATNLARREDALELDCDILIPAALERQITAENAPRVKAKIVVEAANGPTTPEADEILAQRGILVIPDAYINAGGVTVSYFEWVKNLGHVRFGRMQKRFEQGAYGRLLEAVEGVTGRQVHRRRDRAGDPRRERGGPGQLRARGDDDRRLSPDPGGVEGAAGQGGPAHRGADRGDRQGGAELRAAGHLPVSRPAGALVVLGGVIGWPAAAALHGPA